MTKKTPHIEHRRTINIFILVLLCMAVVISLRNLPLTATFGLSLVFFYVTAALFFMIPYALVSAELASGWPKAGGVYIWVREALGERWGFFAIWMQWFHNMTWYPAMLAFAGAGLAYVFSPELYENKLYLTSVIFIGFWVITFLNFLGIKTSSLVSSLCLILGTVIPGILLITFAISWIAQGNLPAISLDFNKLIPEMHFSNIAFLAGIFLALSGLEVNANLARDVKNPQKNYPRAIFIATFFILLILILGSLSIAIVIPKTEISLVAGLLEAFAAFLNIFNVAWLIPVVALFIILGALGELNAWTIAGAKGLFVTTEYGSLPPILHKVNKRHVPVNLLIFQAIIVSITAFIFVSLPNVNVSYWILSAISAQMYIFMYMLLFIAGIVLRYKKPHVVRAYRIPFKNVGIWVVSIVGLLACCFVFVLSFFPPTDFETGDTFVYEIIMMVGIGVCIALPLVIYALRKPHWKVEVLEDIREEIHRSIH